MQTDIYEILLKMSSVTSSCYAAQTFELYSILLYFTYLFVY